MKMLHRDRDFIAALRETESQLRSAADSLAITAEIREFPLMITEIKKLKPRGKVTTAWVQKHFKIGYARASRLIDELK